MKESFGWLVGEKSLSLSTKENNDTKRAKARMRRVIHRVARTFSFLRGAESMLPDNGAYHRARKSDASTACDLKTSRVKYVTLISSSSI